jgi:hypothetical protein
MSCMTHARQHQQHTLVLLAHQKTDAPNKPPHK